MKAAQKLRAEFWVLVEKNMRRADRTGDQRIHRNDFSLPLRAEQVPVGLDLAGTDQLGVESNIAAARRALEDENKTILRIIVMVFALVPRRHIENLGQQQ